jgi:GH24 family phage-related lysozyme (muramidase)
MNDSEYRKKLEEFEGYAEHMYLDGKGYVTIGIGIMLASAAAAKSAGIKFTNRDTGKAATPEEIEADYNAVKGATAGMFPPSKYKKFTKLDGDAASLKKELDARLKTAESDRKAFYKDVADLPSSVQYALLDMAFNLGRGGLMKYKKLKAALEKEDWKTAAKESNRNGIQASRNKAIYDWILAGEKG